MYRTQDYRRSYHAVPASARGFSCRSSQHTHPHAPSAPPSYHRVRGPRVALEASCELRGRPVVDADETDVPERRECLPRPHPLHLSALPGRIARATGTAASGGASGGGGGGGGSGAAATAGCAPNWVATGSASTQSERQCVRTVAKERRRHRAPASTAVRCPIGVVGRNRVLPLPPSRRSPDS